MGLAKGEKTDKAMLNKLHNYFFTAVVSLFVLGFININTAYAQSCNLEDKGNILKYSKGCAPRDPEWEIIYFGLDLPATVVVDWGDGDSDSKIATSPDFQETFTHTYPKDEGVCTYNVIAYVESNGVRCQETEQEQKITVWDTDNPANGKLAINPFIFRVCYGNEAHLSFIDNSSWNCFDPSETSTPNDAPRWIQWVYGTGNPLNRIPGVEVNGSAQTYPYKDGIPAYPVTSPGLTSYDIYVPATTTIADIGKEFVITLRNWNQCNPYDVNLADGNAFNPLNGDLDNGDSTYVYTTAKIIIVAPPDPEFTARKESYGGAESYQFCPNERIFFRNATSASAEFKWEFIYHDGTPNGTIVSTKNGINVENSFSTAGKYTARLIASDPNAEGACIAIEEKEIEIIKAPEPVMEVSLDGAVVTNYNFCERVGGEFDLSITNETSVPSGSSPKYTWKLSKDGVGIKTMGPTTDKDDLFTFTLSEPGAYKVSLTALDENTKCGNTEEITINIHNAPHASFEIASAQELCVGREVAFSDLSDFVSPKGFTDDAIVGWEWWFDYENNPASQSTDQNPIHKFTAVGDYKVRLEVTTKYGCVDDTVYTLTVNPVAEALITVDDPDGCAPFEPTFTNVKANNQPASVTVEKYRWLGYYNGAIVFDEEQFPDGTTGDFENTFTHAFPYTRTDNEDQVYKVIMEAYALEGCVTTSDTVEITVFSTASAKFVSDYDPYGSNCSPVQVNFEVDATTKALPFTKTYEWTITDEKGAEVYKSPSPTTVETFQYDFTSLDSIAVKDYEVTLTVYATSGPCIQPYTQQIKVNPTPSSKFTASLSPECESVVLNLDANQKGLSPANYYWTILEQNTGLPKKYVNSPALDDNFSLQFLRGVADSVIEVTLRTKNFAGCESTGPTQQFVIPKAETFEVKLDTMPAVPKCAPYPITFYNNSTVPSGTNFALRVQKGSGPAVTIPAEDITGNISDAQFTYTFDVAGDYIVTLVGNDTVSGCEAEAYVNITIHPAVEAVFNPGETEVCPGQQVFLNEASQAPSLIAQKIWTITNLDNSSQTVEYGSKLFHIFDEPGDYEVKLAVVSINGCTDEEIKNIKVLPEPAFDVSYNASSCNQSFLFSIAVEDPTVTIANFIWKWGDGKTDTTTAPENAHIYLNRNGYNGQDVYKGTVTATASTGCTYTETFTVTLLQDVSASFLMDKDKGCAPLTVVFDNLSLGAASQSWTYREISPTVGGWQKFDGVDTVFYNATNTTKVFEVQLVSRSADGCEDTQVKKVTVYPQVSADFAIDNPTGCSPLTVKLTNNGVRDHVEYVWDWGDGKKNDTTEMETSLFHTFDNSSFSTPRNFKVRLTARDKISGCTVFLEKTVTVRPAVIAIIEPDDTVGCSPLTVDFTNDFQGVATHEWYAINTETGLKVASSEGAGAGYTFTFVNTTFDTVRYQVIYQGTSSQGCVARDTAAILVYPEIAPSFSASPMVQNLPNSTVTVHNTTHNNPEYTYEWDFGNGTFSRERNPDPVIYETYGTYTITLKVSDQFRQCPQEVTQQIEIKPTVPEIDFEYHPAEGCGPLTVQFVNKSKYVDPGSLLWDFGDNSSSFSHEENPTYTYYEPGEYTVTLQGTNAIGVTITETKHYIINVYDNPRASFRVRQRMPVYMPDSVIFLNESSNAVSYLWDFGDGVTSTEFEPKHAYAAPGNYTIKLIATSEQGCVDTLVRVGEIEVEGQFEVKIPNVFTPNGDQDNEIFLPLMQGVVEYNLLIFNRWGELLFESKSQEVGWDGYYKGVLCPPGVYIYKLDLKFVNGEKTTKFGDVTLLR